MDIQLVFPKHEFVTNIQYPQPPNGLLSLAQSINQEIPGLTVGVYDGMFCSEEDLLQELNSSIIGMSTWFSNYSSALRLSRAIKQRNPATKILFGGPHAGSMPRRVLQNNYFIDTVFTGDAEQSLVSYLRNESYKDIAGLSYRDGNEIMSNPPDYGGVDLKDLSPFTLENLRTPFSWTKDKRSYFPVSLYRGCFLSPRCKHCSIPVELLRRSKPQQFWRQLESLYDSHGVNSFFETADIFPMREINDLLDCKPEMFKDISLRVYIYPSTLNKTRIEKLAQLGVTSNFMGIENVMHLPDSPYFFEDTDRTFRKGYGTEDLIQEIELLGSYGIRTMPGFVLGLPGESKESLIANKELIRRISNLDCVEEFSVNTLLLLPGSAYFREALSNELLCHAYTVRTGDNLREIDVIDFSLLSELFFAYFTDVTHQEVRDVYLHFADQPVSHWF